MSKLVKIASFAFEKHDYGGFSEDFGKNDLCKKNITYLKMIIS